MSPKLAVLTASAAAILTTTAVLACDVHSGQPEHLHAAASSSDDPARIDISSSPMPGEPSLAEIRRATEKYRDIQVALAEGYIRDPSNMCETAEMMGEPKELGAMGVHYFRPDLLGITAPPNPRVDGASTHFP